VEDLVSFSNYSWLILFLWYGLAGILAHFISSPGNAIEIVNAVAILLNLVVIVGFFCWKKVVLGLARRDFDLYHDKETAHQQQAHAKRISLDRTYTVVVQALLFLSAYGLSRILCSKRFYTTDDFKGDEWMVATFAMVYILSGFVFMPQMLPWASIIFSVPPFMDVEDYGRIQDVVHRRPNGLDKAKAQVLLFTRTDSILASNKTLNFATQHLRASDGIRCSQTTGKQTKPNQRKQLRKQGLNAAEAKATLARNSIRSSGCASSNGNGSPVLGGLATTDSLAEPAKISLNTSNPVGNGNRNREHASELMEGMSGGAATAVEIRITDTRASVVPDA